MDIVFTINVGVKWLKIILNKKLRFKNDYEIPENLENLIKRKDKNYSLSKSILAFFTNNKIHWE